VDQNEEHDNPKDAPYHFQYFYSLVRLFACLDWNCNDNRMLSRGPKLEAGNPSGCLVLLMRLH